MSLQSSLYLFVVFLLFSCAEVKDEISDSKPQTIISSDINRFWQAYDEVLLSNDTIEQKEIVERMFIDGASVGQKKMMEVRNYDVSGYVSSMNSNRPFWNSLRKTTEDLTTFNAEIQSGIAAFKTQYPQLIPAAIYYTIGTHRSPGTGVDSLVLIGTEFALGKQTTNVSTLPANLQSYYEINPVDHFQFLVIHEYVHTQQKPMVHNLLSLALYEGIADFVAQKVTGKSSPFDAFDYGRVHVDRIRDRFESDMFRPNVIYQWLWNSPNNEFGTRDLGYFVGFSIAEGYYEQSEDPKAALAALIELDYEQEDHVGDLVDASGFFSQPLDTLYARYEASRPSVIKLEGFENEGANQAPGRKIVTLHFSEPMSPETRGFDYGPLGEDHVMRVQKIVGFSADSTSFTFEVELEPNKHYQSLATNRFMSAKGVPMKAFLLDVQTGK